MISVESLFWTQGDRGRIAHDFSREFVLDAGRPGTDRPTTPNFETFCCQKG
jgi:hypothetical protein